MQFCFVIKNHFLDCPPLHRLLKRLSEEGHELHVMCIENSKTYLEYAFPLARGGVWIHGVSRAAGVSSYFRPLLEIPRLTKALRSTPAKYDVCVAFDPYALEAVRQSGMAQTVPVIYYSLELWDEFQFWPQRLCERLSRGAISGLVCPQEDRLSYLKKALGFSGPSMVFPNVTFDYAHIVSNQMRRAAPRPPTVFAYLGGLQLKKRAILELIEVFGNRVEEARLVIYGRANPEEAKLLNAKISSVRWPTNISVFDFVPYGQQFRTANQWHVGVMLYANVSLNYKYCAPNKIYEYSMLGLPVLASNQPHLLREIEGGRFGLCVNPESLQDIEYGIKRLCQADNLDRLGRNARKWYLSQAYDTYFHKFLELIVRTKMLPGLSSSRLV